MGSLDAPISAENGTAPAAGHGKSPLTDGGMRPPPSDSVPEYELVKRRRSSVLPLEVGTRVMCRWRDGKYHPVKVIERRRVHGCGPNDYEYYVHYTECMNLIFIFCSFFYFYLMKFRVFNCEPCLILGFVVWEFVELFINLVIVFIWKWMEFEFLGFWVFWVWEFAGLCNHAIGAKYPSALSMTNICWGTWLNKFSWVSPLNHVFSIHKAQTRDLLKGSKSNSTLIQHNIWFCY